MLIELTLGHLRYQLTDVPPQVWSSHFSQEAFYRFGRKKNGPKLPFLKIILMFRHMSDIAGNYLAENCQFFG